MPNPFVSATVVGVDYPNEDYVREEVKRGDPAYRVSRGMLMLVLANAHKWRAGFIQNETKALELGSIMDCMVLPPSGGFLSRYTVRPATYFNEKKGVEKKWNNNASACKEWLEEHEDDLICKPQDVEAAEAALAILRQDDLARDLLECSDKQMCIHAIYQDDATGLEIPAKCLIDLRPNFLHQIFGLGLADFKTSQSVLTAPWIFAIDKYNYDAQAAMELDIYRAAFPDEDRTQFWHLVQESYPPFEVGRKEVDRAFIELGRQKYLAAIQKYARCLARNTWPGPDDESANNRNGWTVVGPTANMLARVNSQILESEPEFVSEGPT